jgi:hypothetical protein
VCKVLLTYCFEEEEEEGASLVREGIERNIGKSLSKKRRGF